MKKAFQHVITIGLLLIGSQGAYAQQGMVASGGDASSAQGKVSFSVGQIDYKSMNDTTGSVSAGIQQPYEIFVVSGLEEKNIGLTYADHIQASVFPNPTQEFVILKIEGKKELVLSYELYDLQWKLIKQAGANSGETLIDLSECNSAGYFMKVLGNNQQIKLFKIIKNQ